MKKRGFTLIELLLVILILSIGLLGIAGLLIRAQQAEFEAFQRARALILLDHMAGRIAANRGASGCYDLDGPSSAYSPSVPFIGTPEPGDSSTGIPPTCTSYGTTATRAVANADLSEWDAMLEGAAEYTEDAGGNVDLQMGSMIGARGCIVANADQDQFTISVAWQGIAETVEPADTCGENLYGDEAQRRVISRTVELADLT